MRFNGLLKSRFEPKHRRRRIATVRVVQIDVRHLVDGGGVFAVLVQVCGIAFAVAVAPPGERDGGESLQLGARHQLDAVRVFGGQHVEEHVFEAVARFGQAATYGFEVGQPTDVYVDRK